MYILLLKNGNCHYSYDIYAFITMASVKDAQAATCAPYDTGRLAKQSNRLLSKTTMDCNNLCFNDATSSSAENASIVESKKFSTQNPAMKTSALDPSQLFFGPIRDIPDDANAIMEASKGIKDITPNPLSDLMAISIIVAKIYTVEIPNALTPIASGMGLACGFSGY